MCMLNRGKTVQSRLINNNIIILNVNSPNPINNLYTENYINKPGYHIYFGMIVFEIDTAYYICMRVVRSALQIFRICMFTVSPIT